MTASDTATTDAQERTRDILVEQMLSTPFSIAKVCRDVTLFVPQSFIAIKNRFAPLLVRHGVNVEALERDLHTTLTRVPDGGHRLANELALAMIPMVYIVYHESERSLRGYEIQMLGKRAVVEVDPHTNTIVVHPIGYNGLMYKNEIRHMKHFLRLMRSKRFIRAFVTDADVLAVPVPNPNGAGLCDQR